MGNVPTSGEEAYQITLNEANKLGEGSFATVYKIKRLHDNLLCAGKIFKISLSNMNSKEEMGYERELKIMKEADHPFIVEYIEEFSFKKNQLCIVTKLASGGDFEKYMNKNSFNEDEAMEYFAMILLGLNFLHNKGIFHRDLKPGNILIDELKNGMKILKIGDFGISKMNLQTMKQTQTTFGNDTTPAYKAPEVLSMKKPTAKVDMWAVGIILYQLLTQKHPFMQEDPWQTIIAIRDLEPHPLPSSIKEDNKKIVRMLLQKNPEIRPDAQTLLSTKEVQKIVQKLVEKIKQTDPEISTKIFQKNSFNPSKNIEIEVYLKAFREKSALEQQPIKTNQEKQTAKQRNQLTYAEIMNEVFDELLMDSTCTSKKEKEYLLKLLGNKRFFTHLLLRASIHGWEYYDFHLRCDNKGPTISLFKVKDGDCIGGYTNAQWSSTDHGKFVGDSHAMLFNLSKEIHFPNKRTGYEIYSTNSLGPCFINGDCIAELCAFQKPFNEENSCVSYAKGSGYDIPVDGAGKNMLTNKKDGYFTITELEVWEVRYD